MEEKLTFLLWIILFCWSNKCTGTRIEKQWLFFTLNIFFRQCISKTCAADKVGIVSAYWSLKEQIPSGFLLRRRHLWQFKASGYIYSDKMSAQLRLCNCFFNLTHKRALLLFQQQQRCSLFNCFIGPKEQTCETTQWPWIKPRHIYFHEGEEVSRKSKSVYVFGAHCDATGD